MLSYLNVIDSLQTRHSLKKHHIDEFFPRNFYISTCIFLKNRLKKEELELFILHISMLKFPWVKLPNKK